MRALRPLLLLAALLLVAPVHAASDVSFGPNDVRSVFYVSKSENQNQVHYAVRLDTSCRPVGPQPVFAYWRRLRKGSRIDEPLVGAGTRVYGASDVQRVTTSANGGTVQTFVKALDRVRIEVRSERGPKGCTATATTAIKGARAKLSHAYLQLGTLGLRVKYVDVHGYRISDGAKLTQRFE
jgi:hypothetical protein